MSLLGLFSSGPSFFSKMAETFIKGLPALHANCYSIHVLHSLKPQISDSAISLWSPSGHCMCPRSCNQNTDGHPGSTEHSDLRVQGFAIPPPLGTLKGSQEGGGLQPYYLTSTKTLSFSHIDYMNKRRVEVLRKKIISLKNHFSDLTTYFADRRQEMTHPS